MFGVVVNSGHDVRSTEALRILERCVGHNLAGFEIDETGDDGRGAKIDSQAVNGSSGPCDLLTSRGIDDTLAFPDDGRIEHCGSVRDGQVQSVALDAHLPTPHRVALDLTVLHCDPTLA